ncbi:MAG: FkbM family methyltransferase, partial [Gammaproteobacteria bacterium]
MGDFKFHVHRAYDKYISGDLIRDNIWEPFETEVFRRLCKPGDFVVDIGANIGWYSVIASRLLGSSGRVLSIEPDSSNLQLLRTNLA